MMSINLSVLVLNVILFTSAFAVPAASLEARVFRAPSIISPVWTSLGQALGTDPLTYTMSLKGQDMEGLTEKMYQIADSQGEWLTKDELKQYASVSDEGRDAIISYLKSQGLKDSDFTFSALGDEVEIRSSVAQTSQMLRTTFETFIYSGEKKASRTKEYTVDASIADYVQNIYPIASFHDLKVPNLHPQKFNASEIQETIGAPAGCSTEAITPQCLRNLYGTSDYVPSKGNPNSVDIAIMEYLEQYTSQSDLTQFLKKYRPEAAGYTIPIENLMGAVNVPSNPGFEAMLDTETIVAATYPLRSKVFNFGNDNTRGELFTLTFQHFIKAQLQPGVLSVSYGNEERYFLHQEIVDMCYSAQKLSALGTTIVFAVGDGGVSGFLPSKKCPPFVTTFPSTCPFITSVGGTQRFSPEEAVSPEAGSYYSSGGVSTFFETPAFQKKSLSGYLASSANNAPKGAYKTDGRGIPDVSAYGTNYAVILNGKRILVYGTSASAPTFASIIALINDARKKLGKARVGWINPTLYKNPKAFNDVTPGGSLGCGDENTGFNATIGYDLAGGLGTPKFAALRAAFGA